MMMNFNPQFNTNKKAPQGVSYRMPAFLGATQKGVLIMNGDYEPRFVKLLYDYAEFEETDKSFNKKFVGLAKEYAGEKPQSYPNWFKKLLVAFKRINDNDVEAIQARTAITSSDFRYLVLNTLQDFKSQNKHLDIIKKDYSKYINLDVEG